MDNLRLTDSVRRITVLHKNASGGTMPVVIYKKKSDGKKGSKIFKGAERTARRLMKAQQKTADRYLEKHAKSNRKKKDGWLRDWVVNTVKADTRGAKELKLRRLFSY